MRPSVTASLIASLLCLGGDALAQPADPPPPDEEPADPWADDAPAAEPTRAPPAPSPPDAGQPDRSAPAPQPERAPEPPRPPLDMPALFVAPTGYLLPAGAILGTVGLDTGGGFTSGARIGLGDVAEFGFGTSDRIATVECSAGGCGDPDTVQPYALATFRMGVDEEQLFAYQPALALGFSKSFTREHDGRKSRVAELYLVASKRFGRTKLHAGGTFWDAGIRRVDGSDEVLLHDGGVKDQLRPFAGIEIEPLPRSTLLLELSWAPLFEIGENTLDDDIDLRPSFSWGVRYQFTDWGRFESGVRVPDIEDVNLLDAQIFGQLQLVSRRFERFLDDLN